MLGRVNRYITGEYTEAEKACIDWIIDLYKAHIGEPVPDIFSISEDKKAIRLDASSFTNTYWYKLCSHHQLGAICYDAITCICEYQTQRDTSIGNEATGVSKRIHHDDPRALLSHSMKQWFATLSNMKIDFSTISKIESYRSFIQELCFSEMFEQSGHFSMRLTLLRIDEILEFKILPCVKRKLEQQSAKEKLEQIIEHLEATVNTSIFYIYYIAHEERIQNKSIESLTDELRAIKMDGENFNFINHILQKLLLHENDRNRQNRIAGRLKGQAMSSISNYQEIGSSSLDIRDTSNTSSSSIGVVQDVSPSSSSSGIEHSLESNAHWSVKPATSQDVAASNLLRKSTICLDENPFLRDKNMVKSSELSLANYAQNGLYKKLITINENIKENFLYLGGYLYELQKAIYVLKKAEESARLGGDLLIYGFFRDLLTYFLADLIELIKRFEIVFTEIKKSTQDVLKENIKNPESKKLSWQFNFQDCAIFCKEVSQGLIFLYSTINDLISITNSKSFDGLLLEMEESAILFCQEAFVFTKHIRFSFEKPPIHLSQPQREKIGFITHISEYTLGVSPQGAQNILAMRVAPNIRVACFLGEVHGLLKGKNYVRANQVLQSISVEEITENSIKSKYFHMRAKLLRKLNIKNIKQAETWLEESVKLIDLDDVKSLFEIKIEFIKQYIFNESIENMRKALIIREGLREYANSDPHKLSKLDALIESAKTSVFNKNEKSRRDAEDEIESLKQGVKIGEISISSKEKELAHKGKEEEKSSMNILSIGFFGQSSKAEDENHEKTQAKGKTEMQIKAKIIEEKQEIEKKERQVEEMEAYKPPRLDPNTLEKIPESGLRESKQIDERTPFFSRSQSTSEGSSSIGCCCRLS